MRIAVALALLFLGSGCVTDGRFATCETDQDCETKGDGERPFCTNLRCVECAYDRHCEKQGGVCDTKNQKCIALD